MISNSHNLQAKAFKQLGLRLNSPSQPPLLIGEQESKNIQKSLAEISNDPIATSNAHQTLSELLNSSVILLSTQSQIALKHLLGDKIPALSRGEIATLAGGHAAISTDQLNIQKRRKAVKISLVEMKKNINAMRDNLPTKSQALLISLIREANQLGLSTFDSDARKEFSKFFSTNNQKGQIDRFTQIIKQTENTSKLAHFNAALANKGNISDITTSFLFSQLNKLEEKLDTNTSAKEVLERHIEEYETIAEHKEVDGYKNQLELSPEAQSEAKKVLQSVLNSADSALHRNYDSAKEIKQADGSSTIVKSGEHADNSISKHEAEAIAVKLSALENLSSTAQFSVAYALSQALRSSDLVDLGPDTPMRPILEWAEKILEKAGLNIDIDTTVAEDQTFDFENPIAKAFSRSDNISHKLGAFLLEGLTSTDKNLKEKLVKLSGVLKTPETQEIGSTKELSADNPLKGKSEAEVAKLKNESEVDFQKSEQDFEQWLQFMTQMFTMMHEMLQAIIKNSAT